jgi:hypothetical protein
VIDGDTVVVMGTTLRLKGVDAAELGTARSENEKRDDRARRTDLSPDRPRRPIGARSDTAPTPVSAIDTEGDIVLGGLTLGSRLRYGTRRGSSGTSSDWLPTMVAPS